MKKLFLKALFLGFLFSACKSIQEGTPNTPSTLDAPLESTYQQDGGNGDPVFELVDQRPQFPGGLDSLASFLRANIVYPSEEKNSGIEGISYIQFVVRKTGLVTDVGPYPPLKRKATSSMHAESMRVVRLMPAWTPGMQDGKLVSCRFVLPIKYTLK